jgi:carbamoyl-phosphate synthase large subunit
MKTILITGIGGTRSIAVLKALRASTENYTIIGTDANYFNAGSMQCDKSYIVPFASDDSYLPKLEQVIAEEAVDMVFATVEKEVAFLANRKSYLEEKYELTVLVPEPSILEICFDKNKTQAFLKDAGLPHIPSMYASDDNHIKEFSDEYGFPLVRKPVFGYGSKGLTILKDEKALQAQESDRDFVLQKFITNSDDEKFYNLLLDEYTAEVFVNCNGVIAGGIIIKRALHGGETAAGYLVKNDDILNYLFKVTEALGMIGPVNYQFKIQNNDVFIFEINPLLSGTTAVRAKLGFNSPVNAVRSFISKETVTVSQDELKEEYFIRYLDEVFIDPADLKKLRDDKYVEKS